jgi:hypothetical protein
MKKEYSYPKISSESLKKRQAEIEKVFNTPNHGLSDYEYIVLKKELNNIDLKIAFQGQIKADYEHISISQPLTGGMPSLNE